MKTLSDEKILDSWQKNASPWTKAIQENQIETRVTVTNQAIIDVVKPIKANKILDIGCGEGWLVRALSSKGVSVTGIDAIPQLIANAKKQSDNTYQVLEYAQLSEQTIGDKYDVAICNFSLLGKESVEHIFKTIPLILNEGGYFIIQTLHPNISCGQHPYVDGWREGSWQGFNDEFTDPAPWYFRTIESWFNLFNKNGLSIKQIVEPLNSKSQEPASIIIIGCVIN